MPFITPITIDLNIDNIKKKIHELSVSYAATNDRDLRVKMNQKCGHLLKSLHLAEELSQDILQLNQLITNYNQASGSSTKLGVLHDIYREQLKIDSKYPLKYIRKYKAYDEALHHQLANELVSEFASLGVPSIYRYEEGLKKASGRAEVVPASDMTSISLPQLISDMSPDKAEKMLIILSAGASFDRDAFSTLYAGENTEEAHAFEYFFRSHTIDFLGGGNSKNFKISSATGERAFVLKIDNRLGQPRDVDDYLRAKGLQYAMVPVYVTRQVGCDVGSNSRSVTIRTLAVTDFCVGGNLENDSLSHVDDNERLQAALLIYEQMISILLSFQSEGCVFPDMKNTNWLLNERGQLSIADTKSFSYADTQGQLNFGIFANRWRGLVETLNVSPPEVEEIYTTPCSSNKFHAYILGKNLYQYMSTCSDEYLCTHQDVSQYNFGDPIFLLPQGQQLRDLIIQLIKPIPAERLSLEEALVKLRDIKWDVYQQKQDCYRLLEQIQPHSLWEDDTQMAAFVLQKRSEIIGAKNIDQMLLIKHELLSTLSQVQNDLMIQALREYQKNPRPSSPWVSTQLAQMINRVDQIPINDRASWEGAANILSLLNTIPQVDSDIAACERLLVEIQSFGFGEQDQKMNEFIELHKRELHSAPDTASIVRLKEKLTNIRNDLGASDELLTIKNKIQLLREEARWWTRGMRSKAQLIEDAMRRVPVTERHHIGSSVTPDAHAVLQALAYHRHLGKKQVAIFTSEGSLDDNSVRNAAKSLQEFNQRFFDRPRTSGIAREGSEPTPPTAPRRRS